MKSAIITAVIALVFLAGQRFRLPASSSKPSDPPPANSSIAKSSAILEEERLRQDRMDGVRIIGLSSEVLMTAGALYKIGNKGWIFKHHQDAKDLILGKSLEFSTRIGEIRETPALQESRSLTVTMIVGFQDMVSLLEASENHSFSNYEKNDFADKMLEIQKAHQRLLLVVP